MLQLISGLFLLILFVCLYFILGGKGLMKSLIFLIQYLFMYNNMFPNFTYHRFDFRLHYIQG
jgi:hypothetical protein